MTGFKENFGYEKEADFVDHKSAINAWSTKSQNRRVSTGLIGDNTNESGKRYTSDFVVQTRRYRA